MRYKILELLKQRGDFVSGEEIGEQLNVSRTAVWKNITRLKEEGYAIESVTNRGYRLIDDGDVLNACEVDIKNSVYLPEVDSTNLEAKRIAQKDFEDKLLVFCSRQTAGRGRLGRSWEDNGDNVCMSYLFKPDISPLEAPQLTLVSGLALAEALREITGLELGIKWPNDIVVGGKKLSGILTEMSAEMDHINYVVVGIGVNVNCVNFDGELKDKATSLAIELGHSLKRSEVIKGCAEKIFEYYDRFCKYGFTDFVDEYNSKCINVGKMVKAIYKTRLQSGLAKGVDENGGLIILGEDGKEVTVTSGEVSLRLENDKYI
jgi:BirA family biotin operon repressor/biotin-[acetyl-CoA-carboxylase] ligase